MFTCGCKRPPHRETYSSIVTQFGDTFTPSGLRSATGAWGNATQPWVIHEEVDKVGAPLQLFPFTPSEAAFNAAHMNLPATSCCHNTTGCTGSGDARYCHCPVGTDCRMRYAIWPGDAFAVNDTHAVVLYGELYCGYAPFDFRGLGVGVGYIRVGSTQIDRELQADGSPLYVFGADEPTFTEGVLGDDGATVYASPIRFFRVVSLICRYL